MTDTEIIVTLVCKVSEDPRFVPDKPELFLEIVPAAVRRTFVRDIYRLGNEAAAKKASAQEAEPAEANQ